mmetsp:Transcript_31589/g.80433  ORF Transcript_31589/g.80433 Transcript_31589/m.80433 type:complete len:297 (-) Transcript_31589:54-944(-)|eukprot:CAMPEP_0174932680 /NCGR_PEP_ID=MMETSP1355-20121228/39800_1 /TAXON_ID=464990 /ORGANISM="Hemiselmis tepida, Strain CCMP443" /LENGTH=296 /DNA_ID=CAMNT_0016179113 /DNA_START=307 /DNA_END=1197 /DNA_ORIENTATION=+
MTDPKFREIRAIHDDDTIRVYQAYNPTIAEAAVGANSFRAPHQSGTWSDSRMTWIKPSAVWMAYRCGWTVLKDKNQSRVLALDLDKQRFFEMLTQARLAHKASAKDGGDGSVLVQWDPEREMDPKANGKDVLTRKMPAVRSIQIGLKGLAAATLLDPTFVLRISDVTEEFRSAAALLRAGDVPAAEAALWPGAKERAVAVPADVRRILDMGDAEEEEARGPPSPKVQLHCFSFTNEDFHNGNFERWMSRSLVCMDYYSSDGERVDGLRSSDDEELSAGDDDDDELGEDDEGVAAAA